MQSTPWYCLFCGYYTLFLNCSCDKGLPYTLNLIILIHRYLFLVPFGYLLTLHRSYTYTQTTRTHTQTILQLPCAIWEQKLVCLLFKTKLQWFYNTALWYILTYESNRFNTYVYINMLVMVVILKYSHFRHSECIKWTVSIVTNYLYSYHLLSPPSARCTRIACWTRVHKSTEMFPSIATIISIDKIYSLHVHDAAW